MLIDTHLHESKYSLDSFMTLKDIITRAKEIGLNGICITDHESNQIKAEAKILAEKMNFIIIVGAEFLTFEGDMTVFGISNLPQQKIHADELIDLAITEGGIAIASHPFRQNNRGMGNHIRTLSNLSGIEAFNGSTPEHHNQTAFELAVQLNLPALGGSDAHSIDQIGRFASLMPDWVKDEHSFINAIKLGFVEPVCYENGIFKKIATGQNMTKVG